jgi:competence protein ComEA
VELTEDHQRSDRGASLVRLADADVTTSAPRSFLIATIIVFALSLSMQAQAPPPSRASGQLPDGPGKETFVSVCSLCHSPNAPAGKQWTRSEWELKVIEMLQEEPEVTADERTQIVDYLTATFKPGGRIYINLAGAADLAKLLDIPLQESERLVRHRTEKGPFVSVDAVKAVAAGTAAKVDARAKDLEF